MIAEDGRMLTPSFTVSAEPHLDLLRTTLSGFFNLEDIDRFDAARRAAHRSLRCAPNQHLTLVDIRDMHILSQEAVGAFSKLLGNPIYFSKRIAVVVSQRLTRMQVQRAAGKRTLRYFCNDYNAAEAWVLAGDND